jgi:hypothetical protein
VSYGHTAEIVATVVPCFLVVFAPVPVKKRVENRQKFTTRPPRLILFIVAQTTIHLALPLVTLNIFFLIKGFPPISIKETTGYKVHHLTQPPPKFTKLFPIFLSAANLEQRKETN